RGDDARRGGVLHGLQPRRRPPLRPPRSADPVRAVTVGVSTSTADVELEERMARALRRRVRWRYVRRRLAHDPTFLVGATVLLFWVVMALGWRQITPYDPF